MAHAENYAQDQQQASDFPLGQAISRKCEHRMRDDAMEIRQTHTRYS